MYKKYKNWYYHHFVSKNYNPNSYEYHDQGPIELLPFWILVFIILTVKIILKCG
jgi:hypothetical protein